MAYEQFETAGMGAMNLGSEAMARFQTASDMGGFRATKDIEMERREQERRQLAQADTQRAMMRKAQERQKKRSSAQGWGSLIGGALGSVVPGVGTAIGSAGGAAIGSLFGQSGGQVPQGKFLQGGWENLQRREDYLSDQQKAINLAMKPTLGSVLSAGVGGYQTGKAFSDFAKSEEGQKLIGAGGSLLDWTKGKATDLIHGRPAMSMSEDGSTVTMMHKPGLLGLIDEAKGAIGAGFGEAKYQAGQAFENIETAGRRAKGGVSAMIERLRGPEDVDISTREAQIPGLGGARTENPFASRATAMGDVEDPLRIYGGRPGADKPWASALFGSGAGGASTPSAPFANLSAAIAGRKAGDPRAQALINQAYSGAGGDWTTATQQFQSLFGGG